MPKFFRGSRAVAGGLSVGALLLAGAVPSLAVAKRHHAKHHHSSAPAIPAGGYVLKGLDTTLVPEHVGDIVLPSPTTPQQILQRFGRPGPAAFDAETMTRLNGAIIAVHYPYNSPAGVTFIWTNNGTTLYTIAVASPAYHTVQGLHVGSSAAEVQAALPQAVCSMDVCTSRDAPVNGIVHVLSFDLSDGKVKTIDISSQGIG